MRVFLQTDRLTLRRFTESDEDNLFELNSDPEVMRFLNGGEPTPRDEVRTRIIPVFLGYYERFEGFGFWAAVEIATGQFLGWFHFRPPLRGGDTPAGWDEDGVIELGYRLRRSAWGKGYATEGSRALIDKGFTEFGLRRVVAETLAGNGGSRRVLEKSGLIQVGTFASAEPAAADGEQGHVLYELTRADWEARHHPVS
jgi:RimJ/RimL family protein N-acetyltransferase